MMMNMVQAINSALANEMEADDSVMVLGEDVGTVGGVFRVTDGLLGRFGADRASILRWRRASSQGWPPEWPWPACGRWPRCSS